MAVVGSPAISQKGACLAPRTTWLLTILGGVSVWEFEKGGRPVNVRVEATNRQQRRPCTVRRSRRIGTSLSPAGLCGAPYHVRRASAGTRGQMPASAPNTKYPERQFLVAPAIESCERDEFASLGIAWADLGEAGRFK
jgi:hypothetical protein